MNSGNPVEMTSAVSFYDSIANSLWRRENSIGVWLNENWVEVLIAAAIAVAIYVVIGILKRGARRQISRQDSLIGYRAVLIAAIARTGRFFRLMVSLKLVVAYADAPPSIAGIIGFLFTISVVYQVAVWAREILLGLVEMKAERDPENHETLENAMTLIRITVNVIVFAIAGIVILDNLGVDVTGLIAGLGIGGIAIGLAAQGIFSDLFAALSIIFDKPFRQGETISFDGMSATVEKIGLKSTRLRALDGQQVIIGNTQLLDKRIENVTRLTRRRTDYRIGVIYQTDPAKARQIPDMLKQIIEERGFTFLRAGFIGFGDSSLDFQLQFDIESSVYDEVFQGRHEVGLAILDAFNKAGLEFAYPTQTTFTAAPDGEMIMPYPHVMPVVEAGPDDRQA